MSKRFLVLVAISLVFAVVIAACGRDSSEASPGAVVKPPSGADPSSAVDPRVSVAPSQSPTPLPTQDRTPEAEARVSTNREDSLNGGSPGGDEVSLVAAGEALSTVEVVKILKPSVVQIVTEVLSMEAFNQPGPGGGVGTGVILDRAGHILTNNHVIAGADRITVTLSNGKTFLAELVGGDPDTDTAVIRIEARDLQPARLGSSSDLQVGQDVIAIGHALGLPGGPTVSKGVVSATGRSIGINTQITMLDLIQTDAAINPGNSGGPLSTGNGEVVGINTAVIQGSQGIGFAINIDDAKIVVAQLIERGYVERAGLGIVPFTLNPALANQLGVPVNEGIAVARVIDGSAADRAGLQEEDVIVRLGEDPIRNTGELSRFLLDHRAGETVTLMFYRGPEPITTVITLQERPR